MPILAAKNTKVLIQGITGREAVAFSKDMIDYGTNVVAGVTPGKFGQKVHGVPVFDSVKQAINETKVDATIVSVPPAMVKEAVFEAIDNEIKLIVIVAERVPRKDTIEFIEAAKSSNIKIIGPNSAGLISPPYLKLGMAGGPAVDVKKAYIPGNVGILSRSGGMLTEIANLLTNNGIGQETCISVGGDPIVGLNFIDLLPLFENNLSTKAIVLFSEAGGIIEEKLSEYVINKKVSTPIIAFIAGRFVDDIPGIRFGHAATIVEGEKGSTKSKIESFKKSGIYVAETFSDIVYKLKEIL